MEPVLVVTGAALYLASRLAATTGTIPKQSSGIVVEASKATPAADHIHDSFWGLERPQFASSSSIAFAQQTSETERGCFEIA